MIRRIVPFSLKPTCRRPSLRMSPRRRRLFIACGFTNRKGGLSQFFTTVSSRLVQFRRGKRRIAQCFEHWVGRGGGRVPVIPTGRGPTPFPGFGEHENQDRREF